MNLGKENSESSDSLLLTLPKFKTKSGRTVYGGGGITPDIHIPMNFDYTETTQEILTHPGRLLFQFSQTIKTNYDKNNSFYKFLSLIENNSQIKINDFCNWINNGDSGLEISIEDIKPDWPYIENRILSDIANYYWGKNAYYHMLLLRDEQFQKAFDNFNL